MPMARAASTLRAPVKEGHGVSGGVEGGEQVLKKGSTGLYQANFVA
jgi:hypothetical protein